MARRSCPFCSTPESTYFGKRIGYTWCRCTECHSVFRDITRPDFTQLQEAASKDESFLAHIEDITSSQPFHRTWQQLNLRGDRVLEIGPGSGHLLAAALSDRREVWAVETSDVHRKYIAERWGIRTVTSTFEALPSGLRFDVIVAIN